MAMATGFLLVCATYRVMLEEILGCFDLWHLFELPFILFFLCWWCSVGTSATLQQRSIP